MPDKPTIEKAIHFVEGLSAELKRSLDRNRESLEHQALAEREGGAWMAKAYDKVIAGLKAMLPPQYELEVVEVHDSKIRKFTYCRELQMLEAQMLDGTIRTHSGVHSDQWFSMRRADDPVTGYYVYIHEKTPYQVQMAERSDQ